MSVKFVDSAGLSHLASKIKTELASKANTNAVLTKTNTTAFTPTSDYHPATKLYADTVASANGPVMSVFGRSGNVTAQSGDYTKAQVGLGNVDNTSDANKPVSTAQQAALDLKADISTTYTKTEVDNLFSSLKNLHYQEVDITVYPTLAAFLASTGTEGYLYLYPVDTTDLTKGYYQYIWESSSWVALGSTVVDLSGYAPLNSPVFTGQPKAPTAAFGNRTTQIATTAFVQEGIDEALAGVFAEYPFIDIGDDDAAQKLVYVINNIYGAYVYFGDDDISNTSPAYLVGEEISETELLIHVYTPNALYDVNLVVSREEEEPVFSIDSWEKVSDFALLDSPEFTGTPTAPTATVGTNNTQIATTAFVHGAIGNISYNDLSDKPTIGSGTLTIKQNGTSVATFSANATGNATASITVPTKVSDLTNDAGYTSNVGTITSVSGNNGITGSASSGAVTLGHSNSVTAQTTQAVYPIKIDAQGHISAYGSAVTIPTVPSAGTTATAVSTTASGGSATTWSKSDHVHSINSTTIVSALGFTPLNGTALTNEEIDDIWDAA